MAFTRLVIVGALLVSAVGEAQQAQNPYRRYARAIVNKADSAAAALNLAMADDSDPSADVKKRLAKAGRQTRRLAGDFDAVVPPSDLVRVHGQLVQPLKDLAKRLERIAGLYSVTCESAGQGSSCDIVALRVVATRQAQAEVENLMNPVMEYMDARERVTRMLKEHGVELPEIKSGG